MSNERSIEYLMNKSHERLGSMLDEIENGVGLSAQDRSTRTDAFITEAERHFTIEEQAIYSFSHLGDTQGQKVIRELLEQHSRLRGMFEDLRSRLNARGGRAPEEFISLIGEHKRLETQALYEKLDRELKDDEKDYILRKIEKLSI